MTIGSCDSNALGLLPCELIAKILPCISAGMDREPVDKVIQRLSIFILCYNAQSCFVTRFRSGEVFGRQFTRYWCIKFPLKDHDNIESFIDELIDAEIIKTFMIRSMGILHEEPKDIFGKVSDQLNISSVDLPKFFSSKFSGVTKIDFREFGNGVLELSVEEKRKLFEFAALLLKDSNICDILFPLAKLVTESPLSKGDFSGQIEKRINDFIKFISEFCSNFLKEKSINLDLGIIDIPLPFKVSESGSKRVSLSRDVLILILETAILSMRCQFDTSLKIRYQINRVYYRSSSEQKKWGFARKLSSFFGKR